MNLKALVGKVIVERAEKEEKIGSIYLPGQAQEKPRRGKILSIWLTTEMQMEFARAQSRFPKAGDTVYFGNYAGTEIKVDGKEYSLLNESDLLAIQEGEENDAEPQQRKAG